MTDELIDLLHNYMVSIGVSASHEKAQDILLCAMALLREWGYKSPHEIESLVFNAILFADKGQVEAIRRKKGKGKMRGFESNANYGVMQFEDGSQHIYKIKKDELKVLQDNIISASVRLSALQDEYRKLTGKDFVWFK